MHRILASVSAIALASAAHAQTVDTGAPVSKAQPDPSITSADQAAAKPDTPQTPADQAAVQPDALQGDAAPTQDIVVTGIRQSLERAADIKKNSLQIVDSVVAQDIGKLPDPTTAAALQRVPGVQVSVNRNNELADVRVRGLPDILTTVNGREVFTTNGRSFDLQDLPAEALARIDVAKSQTADLIEGGLAGTIDLQLNEPFSFKKPTAVLSARTNYGLFDKRFGPQLGLLLADTFDTSIGKIGVLANGTYSRQGYTRSATVVVDRRSSLSTPYNVPGLLLPNVLQDMPQTGVVTRKEANLAVKWQASSALQLYAEGFYTSFRDRGAMQGFNFQPYTASFKSTIVSLSDVVPSDQCITTRASASGQNPAINTDQQGNQTLEKNSVQTLCQPSRVTFQNLAMNQSSDARINNQHDLQFAGGAVYDQDGWTANVDAAYQRSHDVANDFVINIGQRLPTMTVSFDSKGRPSYTAPNDYLVGADHLIIRNAFQQNYSVSSGSLFQAKANLAREFDSSILKKLSVGIRYTSRKADFQSVQSSTPVPAPPGTTGSPNFGTNEANIVPLSRLGLPGDFLTLSALAPDLNGGARALVPNPDFLLSESNLDLIRPFFKLPLGRPDYDPGRRFDATEKTTAGYVQAEYDVPLFGNVSVDGAVGVRVVETERMFDGFQASATTPTTYTPLHSDTNNFVALPAAIARFKSGPIQVRLNYDKSIRRPDFTDLNPAVTLRESFNPLVQSTGTAGNPDLKDQTSDSYDATAEYYFRNGYLAVAAYYRNIRNRVITGAQVETYNDIPFAISRPRNIGQATLKGVEVSGQYFLSFLPGILSGAGVSGSFTYSDSKVGGQDILAGFPLQGVSKYNYTTGLIYDKFGVNARLVYTFRSKYFDVDRTAQPTLRPVDPAAPTTGSTDDPLQPAPAIVFTRPAGRLDFYLGYDVTDAIRIDIGGTNILKNHTSDYYGFGSLTGIGYSTQYDETTYTIGVRVRI